MEHLSLLVVLLLLQAALGLAAYRSGRFCKCKDALTTPWGLVDRCRCKAPAPRESMQGPLPPPPLRAARLVRMEIPPRRGPRDAISLPGAVASCLGPTGGARQLPSAHYAAGEGGTEVEAAGGGGWEGNLRSAFRPSRTHVPPPSPPPRHCHRPRRRRRPPPPKQLRRHPLAPRHPRQWRCHLLSPAEAHAAQRAARRHQNPPPPPGAAVPRTPGAAAAPAAAASPAPHTSAPPFGVAAPPPVAPSFLNPTAAHATPGSLSPSPRAAPPDPGIAAPPPMAPCPPVLISDTPAPGPTATDNRAPPLPVRRPPHCGAPTPSGATPWRRRYPLEAPPRSPFLSNAAATAAPVTPRPSRPPPFTSAGSLAATAALAPPPPLTTRRSILVDLVTT